MKALSVWRVGAVLIAGAVLVGGYLGYQYVSDRVDEDHDTPVGIAADQVAPDGALSGRAEFKICVDRVGDGSSVEPSDLETVRSALDQALAAPPALPPGYNDHDPIVEQGCRKPAFLSDERVSYRERNELHTKLLVGDPLGPKTMSPYLAVVYFTEPDAYAASFGKEPYATTTEEAGCQGDVCGAVTRAIYIPYDNVQEEGLRYALLEVLNLLNEQQVKDLLQDKLYPKTTP